MPFSFEQTDFAGLKIVKPHIYSDDRGQYKKTYEKYIFAENGIDCEFTESSILTSKKGALRGLHYQELNSQAKLVNVIHGEVFDIALDLREDSETFGRAFSIILSDKEEFSVFIPAGFAHGFVSLSEGSVFHYQSSGRYRPDSAGGIRFNDPALDLRIPLDEYGISKVIATEKDLSWPSLAEYIAEKAR